MMDMYDFLSGVLAGVIFTSVLLLSSCTPRSHLEHEYHVASITINGERTETDFRVCRKEL